MAVPVALVSRPSAQDPGRHLSGHISAHLSKVCASVCLSIKFGSRLRAALTPFNEHGRCLHPSPGGWAARPTPQDHRCPALASGCTAVAEDECGGVRAGKVEGGAVAKAEVIAEVNSCAAGLGEHLGRGDGSRAVESGPRMGRISSHPLPHPPPPEAQVSILTAICWLCDLEQATQPLWSCFLTCEILEVQPGKREINLALSTERITIGKGCFSQAGDDDEVAWGLASGVCRDLQG